MKLKNGAANRAWTGDLILTMDALYQLSYRGVFFYYNTLSFEYVEKYDELI